MNLEIDYQRLVDIDDIENDIEDKVKGVVSILDSFATEQDYNLWSKYSMLVLCDTLYKVLEDTKEIKEQITYTRKLLLEYVS